MATSTSIPHTPSLSLLSPLPLPPLISHSSPPSLHSPLSPSSQEKAPPVPLDLALHPTVCAGLGEHSTRAVNQNSGTLYCLPTNLCCLLHHTDAYLLTGLPCQLLETYGSCKPRWPSPNNHHITLVCLSAHINTCIRNSHNTPTGKAIPSHLPLSCPPPPFLSHVPLSRLPLS